MRVLVVASLNKGYFAPFIVEQVDALRREGVECDYYGVEGKGVAGYLKNLKKLKSKIRDYRPDIIHAHYGLSGLLANLQRRVPVVTTYHGSDINDRQVLRLSRVAILLSAWNIFVSENNVATAKPKKRWSLVPCGIDLPKDVAELPDMTRVLEKGKMHILFAGAFDNTVKNYPLARAAVGLLEDAGIKVQLVELKGYSRDEVYALMYSCDVLLMTSLSEGSPQVIKEAMACGCPIVSVDVGDVGKVIGGVDGCSISSPDPKAVSDNIKGAFFLNRRTAGREKIIEYGYCNDYIARKITNIYLSIVR